MARLARVVAPGFPHHVTQRGNRRQQTFFCGEDYHSYAGLLAEWCGAVEVKILAYCLMPNHVRRIAVPESSDGLRRAIGEVHRGYTRMVNFRGRWRGHFWQGLFASRVLDEPHLLTAARNVQLNPVRAGLVNTPTRYRWSSAAAYVRGRDDDVVQVAPLLELAPNCAFLSGQWYRPGVTPTSRLKWRENWLWSENPTREATCAREMSSAWRMSSLARSTRREMTN
jgi:putative transposase